jgi:hypothetical protein
LDIICRVSRTAKHTIAYESGGKTVDLCKILFGGDGSYYVTAPYHPQDRAIAAKATVNYTDQSHLFRLDDAIDLAVLDDDDRRLKVAHHPDGFLQFSGEGVRSGLDESGTPKGIGTFSWPLMIPTLGPSFQLGFSDPFACGRPSKGQDRLVLPESDIEHMRKGIVGLSIIGYYLPPRWREFVYRGADGGWWMTLLHPTAQALKPLRVIQASVESELPGLIGLEARPFGIPGPDPSFFVSTATGNLRRNTKGELLGDQLFCVYPPPDLENANIPSLAYALPAPPYHLSPRERVRDALRRARTRVFHRKVRPAGS